MVLWKSFISYSCIFISYIQCFEVSFQKSGYFSKKLFFQNFDWSNLIFDQSKSFWKISVSLYLVRLIEPVFRSIEHRESSFFKQCLTNSKHFFKSFSNFPLSLRLGKAPLRIFCRFSTKFLQGFSLIRPVRPFYPFFCFYFHDFMHKLMHFKGFSELFKFGIFVESILFFWNWSLGFASVLLYSWYMLVNLINLGFCETLKILGLVLNPI